MCENNFGNDVEQRLTSSLPCAQGKFVDILRNLQVDEKSKFLDWIKWNWMQDVPIKKDDLPEDILRAIASDIRDNLPPCATLPSESISSPRESPSELSRIVHVDSFLYDDDMVDTLCDEGKLNRNYCLQCGSQQTRPLTFVSHSLSRQQLPLIFTALLPPLDGKILLDVGSRLGAVLYGAFVYTKAPKIVGIEFNSDFCKLQREIVRKYGFQERIEVVEGNVLDRADVVLAADVIILNNVFECFMTPEKQVDIWKYLKQAIKKGTLLVTIPSIENVFAISETNIDLNTWLQEVPPYNLEALGVLDDGHESTNVKLYEVL